MSREYERRRHNREARIRKAHPLIGRLLLLMSAAPQHEVAFHSGAVGERRVAESLAHRTAGGRAVLLCDRRMPRGRGNIDMLAVSPTGVFVIDAKNHTGEVRVAQPLFGKPKLLIKGRDWTRLLDGLDRQVAAVRDVLTAAGHAEVPIQGVVCFTQADLPLLRTKKIRGHLLIYRRALAKRLNADGPLSAATIDTVARRLSAALPPA